MFYLIFQSLFLLPSSVFSRHGNVNKLRSVRLLFKTGATRSAAIVPVIGATPLAATIVTDSRVSARWNLNLQQGRDSNVNSIVWLNNSIYFTKLVRVTNKEKKGKRNISIKRKSATMSLLKVKIQTGLEIDLAIEFKLLLMLKLELN